MDHSITKKNVHTPSNLRRVLIILCLSITIYNPLKAQVVTYAFSSSAGTYNTIGGTVILSNPWDDGVSTLLTIPFTFIYNNVSYTTLGVSANGFITMGAVPIGSVYCGLQLSPSNSIAGYGTDLVSASPLSTVEYATTGVSPNRKFVIQWDDCDHFNNGSLNHLSFQIILNETSNTIDVVWGSSTDATSWGPNACVDNPDESGNVGLLGATASDFNIRSITNGSNTWTTSSPGAALTNVCNMSPTNIPNNGLTYTWTPVPPSPMVYDSSTTAFINNLQEVGQNSTTKLLRIKVNVTGILTPFDLTDLTLSTAGCTNAATDIANAKVYFTGSSTTFSTANQFGSTVTSPNGSYTVSGSTTLSYGPNYFWVAYGITSNATIGDTLSGCCTQVTGSGAMGAQVPTITCPVGYQLIAQLGFWTPLVNLAPDQNGGEMILLSDGSVIAKTSSGGTDGIGNIWDKLTPDIHGSYVSGTWSQIAPMHDTRLYFSSQVLKDGRVYVAGGEYGSGGANGETYNPVTNTWTMAPAQGQGISDANSEILADGRVLQALVNMPGPQITDIFNPVSNTYISGPTCIGSHNESTWVKLQDQSILMVDLFSTNSERYIPALNQWIADGTLPVDLYDPFGEETGPGFLLPNGQAFFIGSTGHTAYYTPTGTNSPGTWIAGPDVPNNLGTPDAAGAMMVNGKILIAVAPAPTSGGTIFIPPTSFYEFNYLSNSFSPIEAPDGNDSLNIASYQTNMLVLPDGNILYANQQDTATGLKYYVYTPAGSPLAAGKPTIGNIIQNSCTSFTITGTLFNGISEGACYGDDWQNATNYPVIRLSAGGNVYYVRSFNWNRTAVMTGTLADTAQFTLPAGLPAGNYWLVVTANGIASDSVPFSTPVPPTLSSTLTPPAICSGTAFTYMPTSLDPNATFTWTRPLVVGISNPAVTVPQTTNPNEVLVNTSVNPISVIYVYVITSFGCSSAQQVTVVVNPAVSISGPTSVCMGDSITLTAGGGSTYLWSTGDVTTSITISPTTATTYTVTATNTTGCADTAFQAIAVNQLPTPSITASGATTFCQGGSVILSTGSYTSYSWSTGSTNDSITATTSNTYVVTVTDANGCHGKDSVAILVHPSPTPSVTASGPVSFCQGDSVILSTGSYVSYSWSNGSSNDSITVNTSNTYTVTVTDANTCTGSASIIVTVHPLPVVSFTGLPDTVCTYSANNTLTGSPAGGTFTGAGITANIFHPSLAALGNNTIMYAYTTSFGCSDSASHIVYVSVCTGIEEAGNSNNILSIYPNPAAKMVTVSFSTKDAADYLISLDDMLGRTIIDKQGKAISGKNSRLINLDGIAKGLYMINLSIRDSIYKTKLVVE